MPDIGIEYTLVRQCSASMIVTLDVATQAYNIFRFVR